MRATSLALLIPVMGCATTHPAVDPGVKLRPETPAECADRCREMGMRLGAVVLIRNSAGCVCEPAGAPPSPPSARGAGGAAAAVSGAVVAEEEEAERQRQEEREQRRSEEEARRAAGTPGT